MRTAPTETYRLPEETDIELLDPFVLRAEIADAPVSSPVRFFARPNKVMLDTEASRNAPIRYSFGVYQVTEDGGLRLTAAQVGEPEFDVVLAKPYWPGINASTPDIVHG